MRRAREGRAGQSDHSRRGLVVEARSRSSGFPGPEPQKGSQGASDAAAGARTTTPRRGPESPGPGAIGVRALLGEPHSPPRGRLRRAENISSATTRDVRVTATAPGCRHFTVSAPMNRSPPGARGEAPGREQHSLRRRGLPAIATGPSPLRRTASGLIFRGSVTAPLRVAQSCSSVHWRGRGPRPGTAVLDQSWSDRRQLHGWRRTARTSMCRILLGHNSATSDCS